MAVPPRACKLGTSAKIWSPSQLLGEESRSAPGPHVAASNGCTFLSQNTANQSAFLYLIILFNCVIYQGKVLCTVLIEDGVFALFFHPITAGHLAAQVSPPLEICHPRPKKPLKNANGMGLGVSPGGGGGGACVPLELSQTEVRPNILTALIHCFMSWFSL